MVMLKNYLLREIMYLARNIVNSIFINCWKDSYFYLIEHLFMFKVLKFILMRIQMNLFIV